MKIKLLTLAFLFVMNAAPGRAAEPDWVAESNRNAQVLLELQGRSTPESIGWVGVEGHDEDILDLRPALYERARKDRDGAIAELRRRLELASLQALLDPQSTPERKKAAPVRLRGGSLKTEDFTFDAASWSLTAHEARPGHEMQFAAMIENHVSNARAVYASNSVNVEGWGLYAEAILLPYEPPAGQLIALQMRLQRAARAFLDPMLNLGLLERDEVRDFLVNEVVLSPALAKQEVDRYTFRAPGQATSYYYGYLRMMELRDGLKAQPLQSSRSL